MTGNPLKRHQRYLLQTVPYTPKERRQVIALFDEEQSGIEAYGRGEIINLILFRKRIAQLRRQISRKAMARGRNE